MTDKEIIDSLEHVREFLIDVRSDRQSVFKVGDVLTDLTRVQLWLARETTNDD